MCALLGRLDLVEVRLRETHGGQGFVFQHSVLERLAVHLDDLQAFLVDLQFASLVTLLRRVTDGAYAPMQVQLTRPRPPDDAAWQRGATALLLSNREILRIEWRSPELQIRLAQASPFLPFLFDHMPRSQVQPDVKQACANALRFAGPAYSTSYFLPLQEGRGQELLEMCLPLPDDGGFLVMTYGLSDLLGELQAREAYRSFSVALTESDGTRLAIAGHAARGDGAAQVRQDGVDGQGGRCGHAALSRD